MDVSRWVWVCVGVCGCEQVGVDVNRWMWM